MAKKEAVTKRLDVDPQVLDRAKVAYSVEVDEIVPDDLEKVHFRPMLDHAVDRFLPQILKALREIGLERTPIERRQRPVSIATWERLDEVVEEYDITKIQVIRCVLQLMASSENSPADQ